MLLLAWSATLSAPVPSQDPIAVKKFLFREAVKARRVIVEVMVSEDLLLFGARYLFLSLNRFHCIVNLGFGKRSIGIALSIRVISITLSSAHW